MRFAGKVALVAGGTGGLGRAVSLAFLDELARVVVTYRRELWDLDSKVFDQMLALNLRAGYVLSRAVSPVMLKQGSGAVVNVGVRANSILPSIKTSRFRKRSTALP